jgi:hypothetical protein
MRSRNLGRVLPPQSARERAAQSLRIPSPTITGPTLPTRIGPVEFSMLSSMIAVRCPKELVPLVEKAGGIWEPGGRRWLIERRRIGPLIRNLRRTTDLLFRKAGIDLDER